MMVRDTEPFLFIGGSPALDLVNTEIAIHGEPVDLLGDESDLSRWLSDAGLPATPLRKQSLAEVKMLRAELRRIFDRLARGQALRPADLDRINKTLAGGQLQLSLRDDRPYMEMKSRSRRPSPAFLIAQAAAEFLSTADLSLVRQCEGIGCILLFYDTTKNHIRRWCSMALCGNRAKVAAYYERLRQ